MVGQCLRVAIVALAGVWCGATLSTASRRSTRDFIDAPYETPVKRDQSSFHVDGKHIPGISLQLPDSYAGLLPISNQQNEPRKFFFWWYPSESTVGSDSVVIWLNGGPGCSSLTGLLQENGPFLLPADTPTSGSGAKVNPLSWHRLANVVWIEQPIGTGFTTGEPDAKNEVDIAKEFYGFLVNFFATFPQLKGKKLYLTGESYSGMWIPYIGDYILNTVDAQTNTRNGINFQGIGLTDPSFAGDALQRQLPAQEFAEHFRHTLGLNDTVMQTLREESKNMDVLDYVSRNLHYPPQGQIWMPQKFNESNFYNLGIVYAAAFDTNKCFNPYNISPRKYHCPVVNDPLGFPPSPNNATTHNFINQTPGFKQYIHADPNVQWKECMQRPSVFAGDKGVDLSPAPGVDNVLARVIEKAPSGRTLIQHGTLDGVLLLNGTLLAIQNMTWNGQLGFQHQPSQPFMINGHRFGTVHTERNLTFLSVAKSGHMVPEDQPAVAFKSLQYLLGQISLDDLHA